MYSKFYFVCKLQCVAVQILIWLCPAITKILGLHTLSRSIKLHGVCECCMKSNPMKLWCKKCLMRCHKICKHKGCVREHQKMAGLLCTCLIWQCEAKLPCYQLPKAKKVKWFSGSCLEQATTIWLKLVQFQKQAKTNTKIFEVIQKVKKRGSNSNKTNHLSYR